MTLALLAGVPLALLAAPHALRLDDQPPLLAAAVWLAALVLRAVLSLFALVFLALVVPRAETFHPLTHWCWHAVVPLITADLGLSGHAVGGAALLLPAAFAAVSLAALGAGLWRAARAVRRLLRGALHGGPGGSLIVGGDAVLVAAAGLRRPRVVVSAGALATLEDDELHASLDHEQGHIRRHHRWLLVGAEACRAVGRAIPGGTAAVAELAYHLERDADRYALGRQHAPAVLARAICKAAQGAPWGLAASPLGGRGGTARRVRQLLAGAPPRSPSAAARGLAVCTLTAALALAALLPAATVAAARALGDGPPPHHCDHDR